MLKKRIAFVISMTLLCCVYFAQMPEKMTDTDVENLKRSLEFENEGVRKSAIYLAGFYRVEAAVIPLMKILHEDPNPCLRLLAARSMYLIGDGRGIYAIYGAARFDEDFNVRKICCHLYREFHMAKK